MISIPCGDHDEGADDAPNQYCGEYEKEFQRNCPLYNKKDVDAVLGGWHINWHDDRPLWKPVQNERGLLDEEASYRCGDNRLVLWTFRDAEPWVEVWMDKDGRRHAWGLSHERMADHLDTLRSKLLSGITVRSRMVSQPRRKASMVSIKFH
jgi:hypothetical protein